MSEKHSHGARRKHHVIYKTTCSVTGRYYIGMHSTDNLEDDYKGSGKRLWQSIKKHGEEAHTCEILEHLPSRDALRLRETELVNEELIGDPLCMNLALGGYGGYQHIDNADPRYKHHRQAGAKAMNKALWTNPEWVAKKAKASGEILRALHREGRIKAPDWTGKKHTNETKARIAASRAGHCEGKQNPMFGRIWIHNDELKQSKSIKPEELETFLDWKPGRKMYKAE